MTASSAVSPTRAPRWEQLDSERCPGHAADEVAGYVDHRISAYQEARASLEARASQGKLTQQAYDLIVAQYDQQMAQRVFGYPVTPGWQVLLGEPERKETSMRIPEQLRALVDQVLLEGRIMDRLQDDPALHAYASKVTQPPND